MPTIQALADKGARVVVVAHLGRPKGEPDPKYSLRPVAERLGELLGQEVAFATDTVGESATETVAALEDGQVAVLENVRFNAGETSKDDEVRASFAGPAGQPRRRLRLRRLRRRAPQAGLGVRRRAAAAVARWAGWWPPRSTCCAS